MSQNHELEEKCSSEQEQMNELRKQILAIVDPAIKSAVERLMLSKKYEGAEMWTEVWGLVIREREVGEEQKQFAFPVFCVTSLNKSDADFYVLDGKDLQRINEAEVHGSGFEREMWVRWRRTREISCYKSCMGLFGKEDRLLEESKWSAFLIGEHLEQLLSIGKSLLVYRGNEVEVAQALISGLRNTCAFG